MEDESGPRVSFDWRQYLVETESTAAPSDAFNHNINNVPENNFQVDQLILVPDKKAYVMVLAKIVRVHKCWIQYQLLGLPDKNLFWIMCDDSSMQPVEPLESASDPITRGAFPITGFMLTNFRKWAAKLYEQNEDKIVPPSGFTPLDKSFYPTENKFEEGMKLAVLDQYTFNGTLLVGTVIAVGDTVLHVEFDGYGHFAVVSLDSRDIFPFEYVEKIGAVLEKPPMVSTPPSQRKLLVRLFEKETTTGEDEVEEEEEDEEPVKRRRRRNTHWQRATVILEQMTGVADKVADILKQAQADLVAENEKTTQPEKESPRVVTVQPAYMFPSTSSQPTHYNMVPMFQSAPFLQSPMVTPVPQVRLVPRPSPVYYQQAVYPLPRQVQYLPNQRNLLSVRTKRRVAPVIWDRDMPHPVDSPALSFSPKTPSPQPSLLNPGNPAADPPLTVSVSPSPSETAECPSLSPHSMARPVALTENNYVRFVYSPTCRIPPSLNEERVKGHMLRHPPLQYAAGARVIIYDLLIWAEEPWELFESLDDAEEDEPHIEMVWKDESRRLRKLVAIPGTAEETVQWVRDLAQSLGCCENFISTSKVRCNHCLEPNDPGEIEDDNEVKEPRNYCWEDRAIFTKYGLTPLSNDEVVKIFEDELGPEIAQMVKEREIQCDLLQFLKPEVIREEFECTHSEALSIASVAYKIRAAVYKKKSDFDEIYRREEGLPTTERVD